MSVIPALDLDEVEVSDEPSCTFTLSGREFRCRAKDDLHWDTIEKWMIARAQGSLQVAVVIDTFFSAMLFPEDVEPFLEMKRDPKGPLTAKRATDLLEFVNEQVLGIEGAADPTKRPASSGRGPSRTASTSKAGRHSPGSKKASAA